MSGLLSVGQRVRISEGVASSRRALILCLDADGCDVEFEGNGEEASNVSLARIAPLLDFEVGAVRGAPGSAEEEEAPPVRAEQHTQQGNQLFKLHDHAAAADEYTAGLRLLRTEAKLSTGARCLVKPTDGGTRVRGALLMVLDQAAGAADLLYEAISRLELAALAEARRSGCMHGLTWACSLLGCTCMLHACMC